MGKGPNVSIVGAGIAGLAAAIGLARAGKSVILYERAAKFEEIGAGLQLGPNAVRALQALGAWDTVEPITYAPPAIRILNGKSGRLLKEVELGAAFERRFGQPYRVAHRADLHNALVTVARGMGGIEIRLGAEIDATALQGQVIAADGVRSLTRAKLFPGSEAQPVPDLIFRALVPMPKSGAGLDCVNLWLYPGGHVVHYPVGQEKKLNLVSVTQGQRPEQHFASVSSELQNRLALAAPWREWPGAYVPPLPSWQKDNITLIGDAAHGTLPFLAQGAAMALEDAAALVSVQDWAARRTRCLRLHRETLKAGQIYHLSGPAAFIRDQVIRRTSASSFLKRLDWIY
ncbi:FAD-dependent monooxygenase [Aestuariivirga litoralis]|uniref:FAD-dependent monooxygenase n=1 Tax=Aestuariivirga litoralis TaxID=2650924 RepID=UPI0018C82F8E|nr:FAD-dependent monooxygenase [Aestuariivirga litoralis]MBG1231026.1 NAD(P)-binding protein [Aestuariivirga litoralis]